MKRALIGITSTLLASVALAAPAFAHDANRHDDHAVFVQLNDPAGNGVQSYHRLADGSLVKAGTFATGGKGGTETNAPVDALASQGGLVYDEAHDALLAVNAGSNTVTVFGVDGARLVRRQVIASGGSFPSSIAVHDDTVYVLNAGGAGTLSGFRFEGGRLHPVGGSSRSLGLANAATPVFIQSPGQVGFTPDGDHVVVTTKANGTIEVFNVGREGRLSAQPVVNASHGPVPFAFDFDRRGRLAVTEAATSSVSTYTVNDDGTLTVVAGSVADGQAATCWIGRAGGVLFVSNTGSSTLSAYRSAADGTLTLLGTGGIVTHTSGAPIDMAISDDGFLYSQNAAAGTIDVFGIGANGSVTNLGSVHGLPAWNGVTGMEGIAVS